MAHLLIVEDDDLLRDGLGTQLQRAGYAVETAADGLQAQRLLQQQAFDALILDLGLPGMSGMDLLRWLRHPLPALPVLILTAREGIDDRVEGLTAGADDYLTKPFDMAELQARLLAMLRRARLPSASVASDTLPELRLDPDTPRAWIGQKAIDLTQRERTLLDLLLRQQGQVVGRESVLSAWQADPGEGGGSNALEVYVHRLRRKLADAPVTIRNVRGLGYLLERSRP